jgi:ABC-type glycerol-3-phosphate transport system substrate-binding protein
MAKISRRSLVGGAAAGAGAVALGNSFAGAAPASSRPSASRKVQGDKTEIVMYHIWGTPPGGTPASSPSPMTQVITKFNETSTTATIADQTPGGYPDVLQKTQADIAAGSPPDVICVPWAFLNFAVEGLGLGNLEDVVGDAMSTLQPLVSESAWPLTTYSDGKIKGLPWGLSTPIFYYNRDIFDQAGINGDELFKTWDSLVAGLPALQEAVDGNPAFSLAFNKDWPTQTIVQSNGGRILMDDGKTFGFTSDEAKAALQTIADIDAAGFYDRGASAELRPSFVAGSVPIMQMSVASIGGLRNDVTFNLGTSTFPQFGDKPRRASTGGSFLAVFSQDPAKYAAITEFLEFAVGPVGYPLWHQTGYVNVSTQELDIIPGQEPAYAQFTEGLERETNWPGSRGLEISTVWATYCERMFAGDISVEDGVTQAFEEMTALLG